MTHGDAREQATDFARRLEELLTGVLGASETAYVREPEGLRRRGGSVTYNIVQREGRGIVLTCDAEPVLTLSFAFYCSCAGDNAPLRVDKSSVMLSESIEHMPLVRYDFIRMPHSQIPAAHINVYGSNDAATRLMLACAGGQRSRTRRKDFIEKGAFPTFSSLHFPVGGDRLRPGIEDVLQLATYEFHIDVADGWQAVLEGSRARYRAEQVRALVREFPDLAFETLREQGIVDGAIPARPTHADSVNHLVKY